MSTATRPDHERLRTLLRSPDFRRLYATRLVSQTGDGAFQAALASFVFFNPNNATTAGSAAAAFASVLLPYSVVGPFAGVLLDRWSRQRVLVGAGLVRAGLLAVVALLVLAGVSGPAFYAGALAAVSLNRFVLAALPAALPRVVRPEQLVLANSVTTTSGTVAAIVGGGIGTGVFTLLGKDGRGSAAALVVGLVCYLGSAAVARTMDRDLLGPDDDPDRPSAAAAARRVVADIVAGARHVGAHRPAAHALTAIAAHRFFYGISTVATLLLYRNYFPALDAAAAGADPARADVTAGIGGLALVFAVSGVGFLLGAVVTPRATERMTKVRWTVSVFGVAGVAEVVFGTPYTETAFLVAALVLGFAAQSAKICVDTTLQERTDDAFRGRVFSFYDIVFNVSFVLAAVFAALTLPPSGKSYPVLGVIAAGYLLTAAWYGLVSRAHDRRTAPAG